MVPALRTPAHRTAEDELTHAAIRTAFREFALEVRNGNVTESNDRRWQLDAIQQANERLNRRP